MPENNISSKDTCPQTQPSFTHKQLVEVAYRWLIKNGRCGIAFKELKTLSLEIPDVIGFGSGGFSAIVECKCSRSDFLGDKKKPFRKNPQLGMGSHRYYCCPAGLIKIEELPEGWGLIFVNEKGKATLVHRPFFDKTNEYGNTYRTQYSHEKNIIAEHGVMYNALRRLYISGAFPAIYEKDYARNKDKDYLLNLNQTTDQL